MAVHTFDVAVFRAQFPAYADDTKYPDAVLSGYFSMATCWVVPRDWCGLQGDCLQLALNLMTAHIAYLSTLQARGRGAAAGAKTASSVGDVSVSIQAPPVRNGWQQWLSTSPYGMQLWALLDMKSAAGAYVGGSNERAGFRKAGGVF